LTKAIEKASNDPSLQEQLGNQQILSVFRSPEEASKVIERDYEVTLKILKQSGAVK